MEERCTIIVRLIKLEQITCQPLFSYLLGQQHGTHAKQTMELLLTSLQYRDACQEDYPIGGANITADTNTIR